MQPCVKGLWKFSVHIYITKTYNPAMKDTVIITAPTNHFDYFLRHLVGSADTMNSFWGHHWFVHFNLVRRDPTSMSKQEVKCYHACPSGLLYRHYPFMHSLLLLFFFFLNKKAVWAHSGILSKHTGCEEALFYTVCVSCVCVLCANWEKEELNCRLWIFG